MAGRREPTFHGTGSGDDHHAAPVSHPVRGAASTGHVTRVVSGFQALSTLIGVPIALASGYTIYKANFAPDLTCTNLRASIVSMLDKNVDPATRRALVKRDVEAFEANCGTVDPDAHAAFKALLATPGQTAKVTPKAEVAKAVPAPAAKEAPKTELRPAIVEKAAVEKVEKPVAEKPVAVVAPAQVQKPAEEPVKTGADMSDDRWLDAVRSALVEQPGEAKPVETKAAEAKPIEAKPVEAKAPVKDPVAQQLAKETVFNEMSAAPAHRQPHPQPIVASKPGEPVLQPGWTVAPPPPAQQAAAPLPPPVPVSDVARAPENPNRPVPPGSVPTAQYANNGTNGGSWVSQIPFVGRIIDGSTGN